MSEKLATHPSVDPEQLERRVALGLIRKSSRDGLSVYNYTEQCQYGKQWDQYTLMARGLILDDAGRVVAKPFPKFFNIGEPSCPELPTMPYDIYEKVDGSLGIWFHHEGHWRVATRGSLDNDYIFYAQAFASHFKHIPTHWTVLTEICMPPAADGMPRAVKHEPGLVYLGAVNRLTHEDIDPRYENGGIHWHGRVTYRYSGSIDSYLKASQSIEGTEGWVVRFNNGLRVKIKTAWYLRLFRAISALTEKHIKELMTKAGLDDWLKDFPEELQPEARAIYDAIFTRFQERRGTIMRDFARLQAESMSLTRDYRENRKAFALAVMDHPERPYLFMLYEGRSIDAKLLLEC